MAGTSPAMTLEKWFNTTGHTINLVMAIVEHHLINAEISALVTAAFGCVAAYYAYLVLLRLKLKRSAMATPRGRRNLELAPDAALLMGSAPFWFVVS